MLIPTYRDADLLTRSLPVFLSRGPNDIEVFVLNNDPSQDVHTAIGDSGADPRVKVIEMQGGFFARAVNRGIRESTGELVMLCNADLFPSESYLSEMIAFFAGHPKAGAAIGKLLRYDLARERATDVIDTAGLLLTRQRRMTPRGEGERDVGQFDEAREVFAVDGAAPVLRRSALESLSLDGEFLDESFFTHKEDHDLSWRLRLAGWECWYAPAAVAFHGRTTRGLGSKGYLSAMRDFHRNEREKSNLIRVHAMKNQWLMLVKNEDAYNFARDFPFILAREALVVTHNLLFAPKALAAVPMTLRILPRAMRKRRAIKARQKMAPQALRQWLVARA